MFVKLKQPQEKLFIRNDVMKVGDVCEMELKIHC